MRPDTVTRAATRWATSAGRCDLHVPNLQQLGLGQYPSPCAASPAAPAPLASFGRMAEASPGKDSVTGHWEIAGIVLDRPFPTFPLGFPPEVIEQFERADRQEDTGQRGRIGHRDHRAARRRTRRLGPAHRVHLRRQRVPDRRARRRRARARAVPDVRGRVPDRRRRPWRRPCDRPAVCRAVWRVCAHGEPARLRDAVAGAHAARPPDRPRVCRSSRSARSRTCSRDAASHARCPRRRTTPASTPSSRRCARSLTGLIFANLVDFDTKYGHRNDVQGYADNLERFDRRLPEILSSQAPGRPARDHRRPRQRPDHAEHGSLAGVRAGAGYLRRCVRTGSTWGPATRSPIWARPSRTSLASARFGTAPAS